MATDVLASAPIATMLTSRSTPAFTSVKPLRPAVTVRPFTWTVSPPRTRSYSVGATPTDAWNWNPFLASSTICRAASVAAVSVPATSSLPSITWARPWPTMPSCVASWSARMLTCSAEASMPAKSMATGPQPGTVINPPV